MSGDDVGGCLQFLLVAAALALAVILVVTATPLAALGLGVWLFTKPATGARVCGVAAAVVAVALGAWLWPREYVYLFRSTSLTDVTAATVGDARTMLAADGFTHVVVEISALDQFKGVVSGPLTDACTVDTQSPGAGHRTAESATVTLDVHCPEMLLPHLARVPELTGADLDQSTDQLRDLGFTQVRLVGQVGDSSDCTVFSTDPAAGKVADERKPIRVAAIC